MSKVDRKQAGIALLVLFIPVIPHHSPLFLWFGK
jgi:hypothetical protein